MTTLDQNMDRGIPYKKYCMPMHYHLKPKGCCSIALIYKKSYHRFAIVLIRLAKPSCNGVYFLSWK